MAEENTNNSGGGLTGFLDVFLSKLKEQTFVIVLMLGVIYFQNRMFVERVESHKETIEKQQNYIDKLVDDERTRLIEREKYLVDQRDKYVEDAINELKK
jgi:hypothetical protein